ncbi:MAG: hypothetical protein QXU32_00585 [Nitrososphaerales archaeon]
MAIIGPSQLPIVLKIDSNPLKFHAISQLGHPVVLVELMEPQMEQVLRSTGDWIAQYFPLEERFAFFMTQPLQAEYPIPNDAYWIRNVSWDPATTRIDEIFGAESFLFNIGNITGIQNLLVDYHLLQAYRKFSQRILGTEGQWEFKVESNKIRLFPVPKGSFPVVVEYLPSVNEFKSPQAREVTYRAFLAQMKIALGHARRKFGSIPGPDGSSINFDGDSLINEGREEYKEAVEFAISLGEPLGVYVW